MTAASRSFECFGGWATVSVNGPEELDPEAAVAAAEAKLLSAHRRLSRFLPESDLCRLNRDPRRTVPADRLLVALALAARRAGELTEGLVDATLVGEIEAAGYRNSLAAGSSNEPPPPRLDGPARPNPARIWSEIEVDTERGTVTRPPGVAIDSGGIAKGLLADRVAAGLSHFCAYAVDCCGDVRIGGGARKRRRVEVEDPFGGPSIHSFELEAGGVATSGITRRSWIAGDGSPAHHLLDPAGGRPAFTGVIQATALGPTAFLADVHAKWALLSGPELAPSRLPHGGVLVLADGRVEVVSAQAELEALA